jgi:histidyl-tRNA synthetase
LLGGPATPGIGWAAGVERIIAAAGKESGAAADADVFIALDEGADRAAAFALLLKLRDDSGLSAQIELAGRSMKGQLKQASRLGADYLVIFGGGRAAYDAAVKNMRHHEEIELSGQSADEIIEKITSEVTK